MTLIEATALKGKKIKFTYKGEERSVYVQLAEKCKNGQEVIKGLDNTALDAALNDPNYELGSDAEFTRTFRINEMFNIASA